MNSFAFLLAAIAFVGISVFVFLNYPLSWRKDKRFVAVLALWHLVGTVALTIVFTRFRLIEYENIRHEISRTATLFFISTSLMAMFFVFRIIYTRTYRFILRRTGRAPGNRHPFLSDRHYQTVVFLLLSFGIALAGYFNIDFLQQTTYGVQIRAKSAEAELRICLIADVHAGSGTYEYTYDDMVKQIDACDADVLLLNGDIFDETTNERDVKDVLRVLKTIKRPRYGVFYVSGNHDGAWVAEEMRRVGVTVLDGEMVTVGQDIQLIGVPDQRHSASDIERLYSQLQPDPDRPIVTAIHRPSHLSTLSALGSDLAVSGHSHGFNVFSFLGANMLGDMYCGIEKYGDMTAVTTSGVSAWGFHYKWPAQSEIVKIHLTFDPS